MHALTNSGAVLLGVLFFFLLIFLAELSYIFCRRTGSFPDPPTPLSKELILQFFMCCKKKNQSRIEPSTGVISLQMEEGIVAAAPEEEAVDKWRVSRFLFTIEEEDLEMEDDDDDDDVVSVEEDRESRVDIPVEYSGEPTPFLTPCDSPPYFTPSPSPGRDIDDIIDVNDVSSRSCCFNFQGIQMCSNFA